MSEDLALTGNRLNVAVTVFYGEINNLNFLTWSRIDFL